MRILCRGLLGVLTLTCAAQAFAQNDDRPLRWHFGAGYSMTTGTTEDYLDDGWIVSGGVTWQPRTEAPFALMAEVSYSDFDATDNLIRLANIQQDTVRIDDGDAEVWGFNLNGVYRMPLGNRARGYVTAGIGEHHRKVEFTQTVLVSGIFCDPWWGFCYPGLAAGQQLVEETSTWRFAWNAGLGVEFPVANGSWFIDASYQRIETREPTEFIPIRIGFRF
jgi:opacity protein-like surface antigen